MRIPITKEQVIEAIRECAGKLQRVPSKKEFRALTGISEKAVCTRFGTFGAAVREAGLVTVGPGYQTSDEDLLKDWGTVVRKLGRFPTKDEYRANSLHSDTPFLARWKWWHKVGRAFEFMVRQRGMEEEWADVLELVRLNIKLRGMAVDEAPPLGRPPALPKPQVNRRLGKETRPLLPGRSVYGALLNAPGLALAPVNEDGVIYVFGMLAHRLGFAVLRIQKQFPDCEALWEVQPGRWQWVRIEFEFESRNFARHGHDPAGCDLIVCWIHNWEECPKELHVVELSKELARIMEEEMNGGRNGRDGLDGLDGRNGRGAPDQVAEDEPVAALQKVG